MYRISQLAFEVMIRLLFSVEIRGKDNIPAEGPYLIASNHMSYLDPPLIGMAFRHIIVHFIAKKELFGRSLVGLWSRTVRTIKMDRERGIEGLKEALRRIKEDKVVAIFPQGTRVSDESDSSAKKGIGFIVARAKVPVVPVLIKGTGKAFPKGGGIKRGARLTLQIGDPIPVSDPVIKEATGRKDYEAVSAYLMTRIHDIDSPRGRA
jgi:1-acyl-sn-glycerol-3-phosphate acyltransferase